MQELMFYASSTTSLHALTVQNAQLGKVHPLTEELSQTDWIWPNFQYCRNSAKTVRRQTLRQRISESIQGWLMALTFLKKMLGIYVRLLSLLNVYRWCTVSRADYCFCWLGIIYTGLLKMIDGVIHNTLEIGVYVFFYLIFVTYLRDALHVHPLLFYKHQHDNQ
jgi:hypothetical protein